MNWNIDYENNFWKIEISNNSTIEGNIYFFTWGKSFIRMTCKDVVNSEALTVDGVRYKFYSNDEISIIEITDLIRAFAGGTITFVNDAALTVHELVWLRIVGEEPTIQNIDLLPAEIPFIDSSTIPFYVQTIREMEVKLTTGWVPFVDGNFIESKDVKAVTNFDNQIRTTESVNVYTDFINQNCTTDKILVEWFGRFGQLKSWWFNVERTIYGSDKQVNIQTLENGYNTLKNKRTGLLLSHKRADQITQHYLSDLVMSDAVYVYTSSAVTSKSQVRIENNSFEVSPRKQDVNITVNLYAYDTI